MTDCTAVGEPSTEILREAVAWSAELIVLGAERDASAESMSGRAPRFGKLADTDRDRASMPGPRIHWREADTDELDDGSCLRARCWNGRCAVICCRRSAQQATSVHLTSVTQIVRGFGCRLVGGGAIAHGARRPEASGEGTRGIGGTVYRDLKVKRRPIGLRVHRLPQHLTTL